MLSTLSHSASRFVALGANLAQVPIALHYLGVEAFGLWMTVAGTVQLMSFADLGLGLGLQNRISHAYGRDDLQGIRDLYKTGISLLSVIGVLLLVACLPLCWLLPWETLFRVESVELAAQLPVALAAVVIAFAIGLPINAGVRLAAGLQMGWVTGLGTIVSSILSLIVVIMAGVLGLSFAAFVAAVVVPLVVANICVGLTAFALLGREFRFLRGRYQPEVIRSLFKQGLMFLVPQVSVSVMAAAPSVIIASLLGPAAVTPFSVCQRFANFVLHILQLPLAPLWPAYAEARSRGDGAWIASTFRKSLIYAIGMGTAAAVAMALLGGHVMLLWTGKADALPTQGTLIGFSFWVALVCSVNAVTIFLNSFGALKGQALGGALSAAALLIVMPAMVARFSVSGAVISMIGASVILGWPFLWPELRRQWQFVRTS